MMKFNKHRLALAAASTTGIFYAIKAALALFFPRLLFAMHHQFMDAQHAEDVMNSFTLTPINFVIGFIHCVVGTYVAVWIFAYLFNHFESEA